MISNCRSRQTAFPVGAAMEIKFEIKRTNSGGPEGSMEQSSPHSPVFPPKKITDFFLTHRLIE
jgi:hypothetical protein